MRRNRAALRQHELAGERSRQRHRELATLAWIGAVIRQKRLEGENVPALDLRWSVESQRKISAQRDGGIFGVFDIDARDPGAEGQDTAFYNSRDDFDRAL